MNQTHTTSNLTISVTDERGFGKKETRVGELTWEKLWETLQLYDETKPGRDRKKFYIVLTKSEIGKRVI